MRAAILLGLLGLLASGCGFTASGSDAGGDDAAIDLAAPDLAPLNLGRDCQVSGNECALPLTCFTDYAMRTFPGGFCSKPCSLSGPDSCVALGGTCQVVQGANLCLPPCNPGVTCRLNYACCANAMPTSGPGFCAPLVFDFCGG